MEHIPSFCIPMNQYQNYKRMNSSKTEGTQQQFWYIYVSQQTKGPLTLRDLDVMLRTNEINSRTFGWKNGMTDWKPLNEIQQIKMSIFQSSNELLQIERKKVNMLDPNAQKDKKQNNNQNADSQDQDDNQMIENKDQDPLAILQVTVENLLKKSFNQSENGKWSIYDEQKKQWVLQDEQPIEKINQMKDALFNKLKSQLFYEDKVKRKPKATDTQPVENLSKEELEKREKNRKKTKRAAEKKKQKWYNAKINTYIYLSGLPLDVTQEEVKDFAMKAGVLRIDLNKGKQKIKLYKDENDFPKGDAVASYVREESVDVALQILNGRQIRQGFVVIVERASFNQKDEEYRSRQIKKHDKIKKILAKKNQQKLLAWDEDAEQRGDGLKIVIMKHIFTLQMVNNDREIEDIKHDIQQEINNIGEVKRIRFYESHPDGIVEIKYSSDVDAQKCLQIMNGRYFDGRQIICEYWDGQTDYKRDAASIALQQQRLTKFGQMLEDNGQNINKESQKAQQSCLSDKQCDKVNQTDQN